MPRTGLHGVIDWLRRRALADVPCGELLERFRAARESGMIDAAPMAEAAFAELVHRHGPKVYATCRRILGDHQLAEDAFQAVFVVLSRRAGVVQPSSAVGGFLHGVARNAAMEALAVSRRRKETLVARVPDVAAAYSSTPAADELAMLDDEIANLSEKYRAAVVLCELDGVSRSQAAKQLRISEGTLSSRLATARKQLRKRLAKRGISLSTGMLAALAESAKAAVPPSLMASAIPGPASQLSPVVATIVQGVFRSMILVKLKGVSTLAAAIVLISGIGLGLSANDGSPGVKSKEPAVEAKQANPPAPLPPIDEVKALVDMNGDPLPKGAIARLGTARQRAADAQVAVSADGKDIITIGPALTVQVWDVANGELRSRKQLPGDKPYHPYLSPHGKYFVHESFGAEKGRRLVVWDLAKGKIAYEQPLSETAWFEGLAFSADERQIAIAENTGTRKKHFIRIWDLASGQMRTLHEYEKQYNAHFYDPVVQFSPDGKRLVAVQRDKTMRSWDLATDRLMWEVPFKTVQPFYCFAPDGKTIVRYRDEPLDAITGEAVPWKVKPPEKELPLAFSPDGRLLAFQTLREGILIWEIATGKTVLDAPKSNRQYDSLFLPRERPTNYAFTPDSTGFIWRSDVIQRWDLRDGKPKFPDSGAWGHTEDVWKMAFSPDGKQIASAGNNDRILVWDLASARPRFTVPGGYNRIFTFTPDGTRLFAPVDALGKKTVLGKWDTAAGQRAGGFDLADHEEYMNSGANKELRVTADGKRTLILTFKNGRSNDESMLTVWDSANGACLRHERVPWGEESVLTPDGESVVAFDNLAGDVVYRALDLSEPRWRLSLDCPKKSWNESDLVLSPDGRYLAVVFQFTERGSGVRQWGGIRVIETTTGRPIMKIPSDGPALVTFSPDNRVIAVAATDGIRFWELISQKQAGFIPALNRDAISALHSFASSVAFSPDSRMLATGHRDCTILLWDATLPSGARGPLSDVERGSLWADLAAADAERAHAAMWRLVADPKASVAFLRKHLSPPAATSAKIMDPLMRELDSDDFKHRAAAEEQLRRLGENAEPELRKALKGNISLEAKRRVESLLAALEPTAPRTTERLRMIRAVHVLEHIESAESRQFLIELSRGDSLAWLTRAADEAAKRMRTP